LTRRQSQGTSPSPSFTHFQNLPRGFPNARQLVIEGASHDDDLFLSSPEIVRSMVAFLNGGEPTASRIVLQPLRFAVR
jgi:hypothetical protein